MADTVYRVTEVIGTSSESWEAAARNAVGGVRGTSATGPTVSGCWPLPGRRLAPGYRSSIS